VTVDVMRPMLSRVTTRDDELVKLPDDVVVPTADAADSEHADADTGSLLPADVMLASTTLLGMLSDRTTFKGIAVDKTTVIN